MLRVIAASPMAFPASLFADIVLCQRDLECDVLNELRDSTELKTSPESRFQPGNSVL